MHGLIETRRAPQAIPLIAVTKASLRTTAAKLGKTAANWIAASGFEAVPGTFCLLPDAQGKAKRVLAGIAAADDLYALAALPQRLPEGSYRLDAGGIALDPERAALGWGFGAYQFTRYRKAARAPARLAVDGAVLRAIEARIDASSQVRDLVNTPTEDMGPVELAAAVKVLAEKHQAQYREWVGEDLLAHGFPTIHAVGRASHRAPRLAELSVGETKHPHLVIVGKGVCFDTGGLDLKSADGMRWMKKDMGGAAHAIALADLVLRARLPVRLTLLIPAVENAVAGNAFRPGEVIRTRAGLTVEIDNTDAEGRLVLCDALAYASESKPDLIVDFATLTGAARIALGPDLPALFGNREELAHAAVAAGRREQDPIWHMPLWAPYRAMLESRIADLANAGPSRHAGSITAALYLERFVPQTIPWLHLDTYAWNDADKPGRPAGGEALGLRAVFALLQERYRG
ncbi:MAG: leucyl aminopeptidase family protein [Rudaea sp.]|uniref:leucyl aminopeptidase family protein n=1 Tax=unclassified Rudaea TaxID=2627037 RepID=UPI0010F4F563|nr:MULTISPECIES: leucyl aminopeptidase family protein [unclassified Rudaea]MBN8885399.1 leucyl aminopeptidase family protein [Rudaea sp.]